MTQHTLHIGRPLPAALALGFVGAGTTCLLLRELLLAFCGNEAALGVALAVLPLAIAAGAALSRRLWTRRDPADLLGPGLGLLALGLPASLLLPRLVHPGLVLGHTAELSPATVIGSSLAAFVPLGLCLGLVLAWTGAVGERHPNPKTIRLPAALAAAAMVGALFVQFVAIPKLTPLNACLDMGLACCVAGLVCAAGSPSGRGFETWVSLLALGFVLLLPVSGLIEARITAWQWQCPFTAIPAAPATAGSVLADGWRALATALALSALWVAALALLGTKERLPGISRDDTRPMAASMAESALFLGILLAYQAATGALFAHLPGLVAAWLAGQGLALFTLARREDAAVPSLIPDTPALLGSALGLCLLAAMVAF